MGKKKARSGKRLPNTDPYNLISMVKSRHGRMLSAIERVDDLIPQTATDGNLEDLKEITKQLTKAQLNLAELIAYRKLLGVD